MRLAIIGAGWAGMAAATTAAHRGYKVEVFEAMHSVGGRARRLDITMPDGEVIAADNGQHILIGAYTESLRLMRLVGVDVESALLRYPLDLRFPDGTGLRLPRIPAPLDCAWGITTARGWTWADRISLVRTATKWRQQDFECAPLLSVADLCTELTARIVQTLIEPLCVAALNTPMQTASGQVFLRVLKDSLLGSTGSSHLLLPCLDLSTLFPEMACKWLQDHGGRVHLGARVTSLASTNPLGQIDQGPSAVRTDKAATWFVNGQPFDAVVLATSASHAVSTLKQLGSDEPGALGVQVRSWSEIVREIHFEAIATVYGYAQNARLNRPMVSLFAQGKESQAQFAFDRGQLGGPPGLIALVASAAQGDKEILQEQILRQARHQLGLSLKALQTVVEKRATFACTPVLKRPPAAIANGLVACGDYVEGPYPATLEGAVRSGCAAIDMIDGKHAR